jgi:hypothetical protein
MKNKLALILVLLISINIALAENTTRPDAVNALDDSEIILQDMEGNGFSIIYMVDKLMEAKNVFEQVEYAEILRSGDSTSKQKREAELALRLINWVDLHYSDVLVHTNEMGLRKWQAYEIYDQLTALELNIGANKKLDVMGAKNLLEQAEEAFYEDRYDDSLTLIEQSKIELESQKKQSAAFFSMQKNAKNSIQRYWIPILLSILILAAISFFSSKQVRKGLLKRKIKRMKIEKEVLTGLLKDTQIERFKKNKISGLVYNIRVEKYKTRLNEIKEELPVLENKIKKKLKTKKK